ncbi:hypothetical protein TVAG_248600 [Trichomonas vaginalis G3]|uniref:Uncharacterized protein n=1 Tax=Trichomonas vaginalis (strain ATCC PRA-98 / G3) TaxID=412133 RepID=A2E796_TRIV3|nr:spectrin binding [Trichomonas vaginalis G3]EAY11493.1 hypothetical protein TVAG_248600 [Trichomonas vaginalis G3]KAI5526745.1 spectrin binding [Trichomonas vaginalis G3]|eukprot:XP_001323716.1 hypothetical protein [Trichomonas vaginalis G3]
MSHGLIQNYEYIANHIKDYIEENKIFSVFETQDIKKIMDLSQLATNDFVKLLKQSYPTIKPNKLYKCTRKANVSIQNFEDVISIFKTIKKYMKLRILDGVIDFLIHKQNEIPVCTAKNQKLQTELKTIQNQPPKSKKVTKVNLINAERTNDNEILAKISELKNCNDFETVYKFFDELSCQENRKMISKSCDEGLWTKIAAGESPFLIKRMYSM